LRPPEMEIQPRQLVENFLLARRTYLFITPDQTRGVRRLADTSDIRAKSPQFEVYQSEIEAFLSPGQVSRDFCRVHLKDRLEKEFLRGWIEPKSLQTETVILLTDLGIGVTKGEYKFYDPELGQEVEIAYFHKYREELERSIRLGLPLAVNPRDWADYLGNPVLDLKPTQRPTPKVNIPLITN